MWVHWFLTIPHKVDVINLIESVDSEAEMIGAVNTHYDQSQWKVLTPMAMDWVLLQIWFFFDSAEILILGAGGAAELPPTSFDQKCKNLWIGNRSISRLVSLKRKLGEFFDINKILTFNLGNLHGLLSIENLLVINCTSWV